jgi:serine O-acetyltransferase
MMDLQKNIITETVDKLSDSESYQGLFYQQKEGEPLPSAKALQEIVELMRALVFPGYYGNFTINSSTIKYHTGVNVERLYHLLTNEILSGLIFGSKEEGPCGIPPTQDCASDIALNCIAQLPEIRRTLASDVIAVFNGDPAAQSCGEVICCYPALRAISNYRLAHELYKMHVPIIPRIITEMAHSETGIDIHPGAVIGHHFAIDHGTGVVIGATSIIGNNVKLYQGVTLGARSFPLDDQGKPIKGIPRHPILEDNVIVYSNATILGRITIGHDATVGGNIWVTENVPAGTHIVQRK